MLHFQEYKNKHPNSNCLSDNTTSATVTANTSSSLNVVASSAGPPSSTVTNVMINQQQKHVTSVVGTLNRPLPTTTVSQNQVCVFLNVHSTKGFSWKKTIAIPSKHLSYFTFSRKFPPNVSKKFSNIFLEFLNKFSTNCCRFSI